jgi:hypothetical protein
MGGRPPYRSCDEWEPSGQEVGGVGGREIDEPQPDRDQHDASDAFHVRPLRPEIFDAPVGDGGQEDRGAGEHGHEGCGRDPEGSDRDREAAAGRCLGRQTGDQRAGSTEAGEYEPEAVQHLCNPSVILDRGDP